MINHDLVNEVLRLKDAMIMFPQKEKAQRVLNVQSVALPTDRPSTHLEWWLDVLRHTDKKHPEIKLTLKPRVEVEVQPYQSNLTSAQKNILKSLSYKPRKEQSISFSVAA